MVTARTTRRRRPASRRSGKGLSTSAGRKAVTSIARPGGNATGINFLSEEVAAKRLRLLHDLVPKAIRVAVLVNSANAAATQNTLRT